MENESTHQYIRKAMQRNVTTVDDYVVKQYFLDPAKVVSLHEHLFPVLFGGIYL